MYIEHASERQLWGYDTSPRFDFDLFLGEAQKAVSSQNLSKSVRIPLEEMMTNHASYLMPLFPEEFLLRFPLGRGQTETTNCSDFAHWTKHAMLMHMGHMGMDGR